MKNKSNYIAHLAKVKTFYIMRHAKSSWDYPALDDYDRPLNKRGERDATRMASWLSQQSDLPEKIITSGAKRAHELAKQVQQAISGPLVINDEIYGASARALLKLVRSCDDELERIMIVGHNPELTTFINKYGNMDLENLPTSGLVRIRFEESSWSEVSSGQVDLSMWPKRLD
jgi:phosphohistidine phosphatase